MVAPRSAAALQSRPFNGLEQGMKVGVASKDATPFYSRGDGTGEKPTDRLFLYFDDQVVDFRLPGILYSK